MVFKDSGKQLVILNEVSRQVLVLPQLSTSGRVHGRLTAQRARQIERFQMSFGDQQIHHRRVCVFVQIDRRTECTVVCALVDGNFLTFIKEGV
jgi:hypothetical protein